MNHPTGENTQDLIALGQPHPAEHDLPAHQREENTRRFGNRCRWAGITLLGTMFGAALSTAGLSDGHTFEHPSAQMFANLGMFAIMVIGSILASAGFGERREQPQRAMLRQMLATSERQAGELAEIRKALSQFAEHLPETLHSAHWKGYAAAERRRLETETTGTNGQTARSPRLGLVPRNRGPENI